MVITGKAIRKFLQAQERLHQLVNDPGADFSSWNIQIRGSRWWIDGPGWLDPYRTHLFSRPADELAAKDLEFIERLQTRCALHRLLAADVLVSQTVDASIISLNDFTLHKRPEIYYTDPDHIRVRQAYAEVSRKSAQRGQSPAASCTRVELYSKSELAKLSRFSRILFGQFLIEQVIQNRFSAYLVNMDDGPPPPEEYGLFDNHAANFPSSPSLIWTSSNSHDYPFMTSVEGDVDKQGLKGTAGRVEEYGMLFGEPLSGMTAADICSALDLPLIDHDISEWSRVGTESLYDSLLLEPNFFGMGVKLPSLFRWLARTITKR